MKWEDAGPSEHWADFQIVRRLEEWLARGSLQLSEEGWFTDRPVIGAFAG